MNKLYDGDVLVMLATADTLVRGVIVFADGVGIAQTAGLTGELISVDTVGVYEFPVTQANTVVVGTELYWDVADGEATTDSDTGTNKLIGRSWGIKAGTVVGSVGIKIG